MKLYKHQQQAIEFILQADGMGAIYHSIGLGKTRTALEIFDRQRINGLKLFVVCPISLIEAAWGEDIKKFTSFHYRNLHEKRKRKQKKPPFDIYIANYEWLLSNDLDISNEIMIVLDESSRIKNHDAKITKKILAMRNRFKYRVIMSGTPAPNTLMEYWAQMYFLSDDIFHKSFYVFRNRYFHLERNGQFMNGAVISKASAREIFSKGWQYKITVVNRERLMKKIAPFCHRAKKENCLDLPEQTDEFRYIELSPKHRALYNQMKRECIIQIKKEFITARVALAKLMKLRQIVSGFALDEYSRAYSLKENPKQCELLDVLEDAGKQQAIIWAQFHYEIERLRNVLDSSVTLYGQTKNREESIEKFKNGEARYLIAHPRSAAYGLTFVNCSLQIFYSLDYSWECYEQARGRTHRAGQKNPCTYIHLICKDTIDEVMLSALKRKGTMQEVVDEFLGASE